MASSFHVLLLHQIPLTIRTRDACSEASNQVDMDGELLKMTEPAKENVSKTWKQKKSNEQEVMRLIAGSALPNCRHACGGCRPCRRMALRLNCRQQSQACPITYRCFCNGRAFPIP